MPGKARSADIRHRVRASGCRYGCFEVVIRSGSRCRESRACCKDVNGGARVLYGRRTNPARARGAHRRPDSPHLEGVQPLIRSALRTGGPLRHPPERSVRPRRIRPQLRSLGPASAQVVRPTPR